MPTSTDTTDTDPLAQGELDVVNSDLEGAAGSVIYCDGINFKAFPCPDMDLLARTEEQGGAGSG